MKAAVALLLAMFGVAIAVAERSNPLGKALELLGDLSAKIAKEGEKEAKAYKEYFEWCDDVSKNTQFAIKTATSQKETLEAKISSLSADVEVAGTKIAELASALATSASELKNATTIREKEAADFKANEGELMEVVDTLGRAVSVLEREKQKSPSSFAQLDNRDMASVLSSLGAVVDAAAFSSADRQKLVALVQSRQAVEADDGELGAPSAAAYTSKSGSIVDVLEDLKEKAETELGDLRKAEVSSAHNYKMLKQSLEDQSAADTKDMEEEKASKAAAEEGKASATGDLAVATKALKSSEEALKSSGNSCMQTAADHEATVKARDEELKVIAEATEVLKSTSGGAAERTYSFLQVASGTAAPEVVQIVKRLARQHHSAALAQLASRIAAVIRYGGAGTEDPFAKVKGLIQDLIGKLEKEAGSEATEKAFCDEEMAKTEAKKSELDSDVSKLTTKIDQAASKSAVLKEEVQELQEELAALAKEKAEADKMRMEAHADYVEAKKDLEVGLGGVRKSLSVLRDYYASKEDGDSSLLQDDKRFDAFMQQPALPAKHTKATGAGTSIIGILEVIESDTATLLAKEESDEASAQTAYEQLTQETKVETASKNQDVKYKTQESKSLDTAIAELSSDRENTNTELAAVMEYYGELKQRCIAKPETYEDRKQRREAEIEGLKRALAVLEDEAAFVQRKRKGFRMRSALVQR